MDSKSTPFSYWPCSVAVLPKSLRFNSDMLAFQKGARPALSIHEPRQTEKPYRFKDAGLTGGVNCTATDCVSCAGGTAALVWIVKGWVQVETTPSVSVTVAEADPVTGPVEAATPVTVAVTPSE